MESRAVRYGKTKILLIEDEESPASFIQPELELEGYEVVWAKDGKEGLELFEKEKPTLILLDWDVTCS